MAIDHLPGAASAAWPYIRIDAYRAFYVGAAIISLPDPADPLWTLAAFGLAGSCPPPPPPEDLGPMPRHPPRPRRRSPGRPRR